MALLELAKKHLRISLSTTVYDEEVYDLITAAQSDLMLSGVLESKAMDDTDPLIKRAVFSYCKANFGFDNADAERLQKSYDSIKNHLTLSQEYTVEPPEVTL